MEEEEEATAAAAIYTTSQYLESQKMCNVSPNHLKTLQMTNMVGVQLEREFVKLVLWWATSLENLEISFYKLSEEQIRKEVECYQRASPITAVALSKLLIRLSIDDD